MRPIRIAPRRCGRRARPRTTTTGSRRSISPTTVPRPRRSTPFPPTGRRWATASSWESRRTPGRTRSFHYRMDVPHVSYLTVGGGRPHGALCGRPRWSAHRILRPRGDRRGDGAAVVRSDAGHDALLQRAYRRALPLPALRAVVRGGLHLGRHGEHRRHHPERRDAARRDRGAGHGQLGAGGSRAGAPVVGRSADLCRLVARVAQRELRHLLGEPVARAPPGA